MPITNSERDKLAGSLVAIARAPSLVVCMPGATKAPRPDRVNSVRHAKKNDTSKMCIP